MPTKGQGEKRWVMCPACGGKTRLQLLAQTELEDFPLFCPKCKQERIVHVKHFILELEKARR